MKVTEEMIVTASQRYADRAGRVIASGDVRAMLEAALADVPEPSIDAAEYRRLWGLCQDSRLAACLRAEAAEAELAKVRAWGTWRLAPSQIVELDAILNGKANP